MTTDTTCTCPSGDGSLRWPCPTHPPTERDERLRGIQERAQAATPGPWRLDEHDDGALDSIVSTFNNTLGGWVEVARSIGYDAEFIATARTDVPWLLAEVARLDAVVTAQAETIRIYERRIASAESSDGWDL